MTEINLRKFHASATSRLMDQVRKAGTGELDSAKAEQMLKSGSGHYDRMLQNHETLIRSAKDEELEVHTSWWHSTEEIYNELCASLLRLRRVQVNPGDSVIQRKGDPPIELKLEPLNIPTFDGALHNWLAFKDAFETLVHNRDLPPAYKLGKLRQAVPSASVPLLAEVHVARFLNLAPVSEDSAKTLLNIVDVVSESLRALTVMKLPVTEWDALTVPIVFSKLPSVTQREWCMHCSPTEISSLTDLLQFLEKRAHSLSTELVRVRPGSEQGVGRQQGRSSSARAVKCNLASENSKCPYCQCAHKIIRCPRILDLPPEKRFEALRKSGLCFNCLGQGHLSNQSSSGGCHKCGRKHNTIFCRDSPNTAAAAASKAAMPATSNPPSSQVKSSTPTSSSL
ncbi:uncharacterized protein LOC118738287 [Rhagoletis pomonella]|uniref:uncharacterized protein LOC118738287 n=1 Tax=Rhagoletis pomonella TaxID=28610 RepID=UPI0017846A9A|nr:uncharacterized protein LOC118738287 [Rhagoletis pomonella]